MTFDVLVLGGGTLGCVLAARFGEDPNRTVCLVEAGPDVQSRVVADASIMPTIPRANTNLSTAAIAERVAELV